MRRPLASCLILLLLAAGCGGAATSEGDFEGAEAEVARAVEDLQKAATDGEEGRICRDLLAAELARAAGDCEAAVQQAIDDADTNELSVQDVRVSGETARARVETGTREKQTESYELVREGDSWRVSSFAAG
jgi:hypothetical protein